MGGSRRRCCVCCSQVSELCGGSSMDCSSFFSQLFQPGTAPYLAMIVVALVIARATDQVFYYRIAIAMSPYSWYFSSCILPIAFLIIVWPIVGAKLIWYPKHITKEMLAIPQHKFAVLGALDTAYNLLSTWPIKATGSTVANVLAQSVLPINMVMSFVVLRTRYTGQHMSGALLVIYGVLLRLLPALQDSSDEGDGDDEVPAGAFLAWSVVLVGSQIFAALSNVYKEVALKGTEDVDVYYMNACISSWQLLFGILTAPLVGLKFTPDYVPLSELGTYISNANKCFFGHNAVAGDVCDADSASPMAIFCIFIAFNLTYNILMLEIFKRGSSVLFVVASAVRLPLVDILLLWPLLAGVATATFTSFDAFALVALLLAMYLYNSQPEIKSKRPPLGLQELWDGFVRHCLCCECGCLEQVLEGGEHGDGETRGLLDDGAAGSGSGPGSG